MLRIAAAGADGAISGHERLSTGTMFAGELLALARCLLTDSWDTRCASSTIGST
jgi:hypothetical protein